MSELELKIVEGVSGTFYYHLWRGPVGGDSLCGAITMPTQIPISAWGTRTHLSERWCSRCAALREEESR